MTDEATRYYAPRDQLVAEGSRLGPTDRERDLKARLDAMTARAEKAEGGLAAASERLTVQDTALFNASYDLVQTEHRLAAAVEALKPFAEAVALCPKATPAIDQCAPPQCGITIADLRRAAAAIVKEGV